MASNPPRARKYDSSDPKNLRVNPALPVRPEPRIDIPPADGVREDPPTVLYWLSLLLSHRRIILLAALVGAVTGVSVRLLEPRTYTSAALAIMDTQPSASAFAGLTASLGLGSLQMDGSPNPFFYADLVTSESVLGSAVDSSYSYRSGGRLVQGNLVSLLHISGKSDAIRRHRAIRRLGALVSARVNAKTGVITVTATTEDAALAPLIVERVIDEVNRINILSRQNQAGGEREFTGRRVVEAAQELRTAENQLQEFLQRNRDYASAPQTAFEEDRLARAVAMRQSIYTSVSQAYEQAKIQEARDTPGLRVVEPATVPVSANPRGLVKTGLLGLFAGLLVAVCYGLWRDYLNEVAQRDPAQEGEFRRAIQATAYDVTHPWILFRRRRGT